MLERAEQLKKAFGLANSYRMVQANGGALSPEAMALVAITEEYSVLSKLVTEQQQTIMEITMGTMPTIESVITDLQPETNTENPPSESEPAPVPPEAKIFEMIQDGDRVSFSN